jgi:hypothetical protein
MPRPARAVEMTASGKPSLERGQPVVPVGDAAVGRAAVLDEVKRATGVAVRDGSHGPGGHWLDRRSVGRPSYQLRLI